MPGVTWSRSYPGAGSRPAQYFSGGIAEHLGRPGIPEGDFAPQILADDGVVGGFDDGGEPSRRLFGALALGEVGDRREGALAQRGLKVVHLPERRPQLIFDPLPFGHSES